MPVEVEIEAARHESAPHCAYVLLRLVNDVGEEPVERQQPLLLVLLLEETTRVLCSERGTTCVVHLDRRYFDNTTNHQCTLRDFAAGSLVALSLALFSVVVISFGFLSLGDVFVLVDAAPNAIFSFEGVVLFLAGLLPFLLLLSLSSLSGNLAIPYFFMIKFI